MIERRTRGQPLVALGALLGCWVAARVLLWDSSALTPFSVPNSSALPLAGAGAAEDRPGRGAPAAAQAISPESGGAARLPSWVNARVAWPRERRVASNPAERGPVLPFLDRPLPAVPRPGADIAPARVPASAPVRVAAAHQMLWLAVLARVPLPIGIRGGSSATPFFPAGHDSVPQSRWSGDGWLMLRRGGTASLATGAAPSTYGASQMGAVLRYRIDGESVHRPAAYLRATAALNGSGEREAAAGFSARPLASVPIIAAVEMRVTDQPGNTRLRPAALVVSEVPPFPLPLGARGEVFAQAGYVGGGYATGFVDGQLRVDREVARFGTAALRAGAGAWGGAQKGASRLDIGPGATMGLGIGQGASARLAIDWRFRVAGDAAPSSGLALTLSAGF